jgi:YD repeat-containing protein
MNYSADGLLQHFIDPLGNATDTWVYDDFGEVTAYRANYSGSEIFKTQFNYDKLGRVTTKTATAGGTTSTFEYAYHLSARLTEVKKNGSVTATYTYDSNGNRLSAPGLNAAPSTTIKTA